VKVPSERIGACWDKLREVYRIHGRWAALFVKLPARLFGIRHI